MRRRAHPLVEREHFLRGIALLDCLIYIALFSMICTLAFAAFYQTNDYSTQLNRNAADIVRALQAGDRWRGDVRSATSQPQLVKSQAESVLVVPQAQGEIRYFFRDGAIYRQN